VRVALIHSETRVLGGMERVTEAILSNQWPGIDVLGCFLRPGPLVERVSKCLPQQRCVVLDAGRLRQIGRTIIAVRNIARLLRMWDIDVVISQGFHSQCYGGPAARMAGVKNVFWCHSLLRDAELRDPIARLALHMPADAVLSALDTNVQRLQSFYKRRCRVYSIHPASPVCSVGADGEAFRREWKVPNNVPLVTIVGRLQPWKGQDVFIRAAANVAEHVPDARFFIVGAPTFAEDAAYEASLKKLALEAGLGEQVIFTGHRNDIPDVLAASDVLVHASVEPEPFGLVITEAMAAGKSVIATDVGGPAEIVLRNETGLLVPCRDAEALAAAMLRLVRDPALRTRMGEAGRRRVATHFSVERMLADLGDVLRRTCGPGASSEARLTPTP